MTKTQHSFYIGSFYFIGIISFLFLTLYGIGYYTTSLEERFFNPLHNQLKPSGLVGHGIGIAGSLMMIIGVVIYMARKRIRKFSRIGYLKYWLEFHIFLCSVGPLLVLYHTAFKFGGIVAVSFWSMVSVVVSGVVGRYIYVQIPRSISGKEFSLNELRLMDDDLSSRLKDQYNLNEDFIEELSLANRDRHSGNTFIVLMKDYFLSLKILASLNNRLKEKKVSKQNRKQIINLAKQKLTLTRRISLLRSMQSMLRYWHIIHLPFALIMLIIMAVHITIAILFGYNWIF